ncbi:tyrosine-type recombinase/integrase [Streptomyces glomeratus]|uniref:tyrosine-type recombinase/integrase n=1 Tax=Streptomyces glomeratus TaxID=284452 RepID=UPI002279C852
MRSGVSSPWFADAFREWMETLQVGTGVLHQARHTLATNLLKNGADLIHVKRYLGQLSREMAEHYVHLAHNDPRLNAALEAVWVAGPDSAEPGLLLSGGEPMTREQAEALAIDLNRKTTPTDGGFCTFQPVVNGGACHGTWTATTAASSSCPAPTSSTGTAGANSGVCSPSAPPTARPPTTCNQTFEPTARAIDGLEKALAAVGLLEEARALDLRRPQDFFGRVWSTAFRAAELAQSQDDPEEPEET